MGVGVGGGSGEIQGFGKFWGLIEWGKGGNGVVFPPGQSSKAWRITHNDWISPFSLSLLQPLINLCGSAVALLAQRFQGKAFVV